MESHSVQEANMCPPFGPCSGEQTTSGTAVLHTDSASFLASRVAIERCQDKASMGVE